MTPNDTRFPTLWLDDLQVGQRFAGGSVEVSEQDVKRFAREYDPQPFHLDDEAARDTVFGGLAASGWHTAGLTMRLLTTGGAPIAGGLVGAGAELSWPRPTRPGDRLSVLSEVVSITPSRSKPERGIVVLRTETRNQHGEVVLVLTSRLMVRRRAG